MPVKSVAINIDAGIGRDQRSFGIQSQGIDLREYGIIFHEKLIELLGYIDKWREQSFRHTETEQQCPDLIIQKAIRDINGDLTQALGMGLGNFLNVDTASRTDDHHRLTGFRIDNDAQIKFLLNLDFFFKEDLTDRMPGYVQVDEFIILTFAFRDTLCKPDPFCFPSSSHKNLGFQNNPVPF